MLDFIGHKYVANVPVFTHRNNQYFQENLSDQNDDALLNCPWVKTGMMQVLAVLPAVWHFI